MNGETLEAFRDRVSTLVRNDLEAAERDTSNQQKTMYHYTDVKGTLGILESGELWFPERAHLNDPVEIKYGLRIAHELFEKSLQDSGGCIDNASYLDDWRGWEFDKSGFWIFIASLNDDHLGQWRNYADDGRGVCLGFSIKNFDMEQLAEVIPHVRKSTRFAVNYKEDSLRTAMQRYIDSCLDLLKKLELPARDAATSIAVHRILGSLNDAFFVNASLYKHKAYAQEQEYRLLISGPREQIAGCGRHYVRPRNCEIVDYLKLPIPAWKQPGVLTHIRIGPAAPSQLRDQIQMALWRFGIPSPEIIDQSTIPYRCTRGVSV
jgi:hypothetical protein